MKPPGEKHAKQIGLYADDWRETREPYLRWQVRERGGDGWRSCISHPMWLHECEYRRKPRIVLINGIEVPEPMREAPERGAEYFIPDPTRILSRLHVCWEGDDTDCFRLESGICHDTSEAAEKHAEAMISFTAKP